MRLLVCLFFVAVLSCNLDTEYQYGDGCVAKLCVSLMHEKFKRLLNFRAPIPGAPTIFAYDAEYTLDDAWRVTMTFLDGDGGYLLGAPDSCVDFRVYSQNEAKSLRQAVDNSADGLLPSFPTATYTQLTYQSQISFVYNKNDINKYCGYETSTDVRTYRCYWELAFTVRGQTQAQYFFETRTTVPLKTNTTSAGITIENQRVYAAPYTLEVRVASKVELCYAADLWPCPQKLGTLTVGETLYAKFGINDAQFQSWTLENPQVIIFGSDIYAQPTIVSVPNGSYVIISFQTTLVYSQATLKFTGTISPPARLLQVDEGQELTTKIISTQVEMPIIE